MRLGLPFKAEFVSKEELKKKTGIPEDKFEEDWLDLKEKGIVKEVLVKYDENGNIMAFYEENMGAVTG